MEDLVGELLGDCLIKDYISDDETLLSSESDLLLCESDKIDEVSRKVAVEGDQNLEKAGNSANGNSLNESADKTEVTGTELKKTSQKHPQHSANLKLSLSNSLRYGYLASVASWISRTTSTYFRTIVNLMLKKVSNVNEKTADRVLHWLEEFCIFFNAAHKRSHANKYFATVKASSQNARQIEAIAESVENASMEAEIAENQMVNIPDKTSEAKLSSASREANRGNTATIMFYEMEYIAVKAMKKCWQDLNPGYLEAEVTARSPKKKPSSRGNENGELKSFYKRTRDYIVLVSLLGCLFVASPMLYVVYKCYRSEPNEYLWRGNLIIKYEIDRSLRELEKKLNKYKISTADLESDEE